MLKKILLPVIFCLAVTAAFCQQTPPTYISKDDSKGFKQENIFLGGGLSLGIGSGTFGIGLSPEIGYTITPWLDAGIWGNTFYSTKSANYNYGISQKNFKYGVGIFTRIYPVQFLFLQIQPEHNWSNYTLKDPNTQFTQKLNFESNSLLAGIGYANRNIGNVNFYTVILIDLLSDVKSQNEGFYLGNFPFIRAGFDFYLRPSKKK